MNKRLKLILDELHNEGKITYVNNIEMPVGFDSGVRLKHLLQDEVEDKYYLSDEIQKRFKTNGMMSTLTATDYKQPKQIVDISKITEEFTVCEQRSDEGIRFFKDNICGSLRTINSCGDKRIIESLNELNQVGMLDIKGNEQIRRVYSEEGLSPTLSTMQGGNRQPKVASLKYCCEHTETHKTISLGQASQNEKSQAGKVYDIEGVSQTLCAGTHGYAMGNIGDPSIVASRGRYNSDGKTEQQFEVNATGNTNTLTSVQKDNYVVEPQVMDFRIRKLTPLECWRLQGFDDEDFCKVKDLGLSDSALYKLAGNSIVVNCLYYIFKNVLKEFEVK